MKIKRLIITESAGISDDTSVAQTEAGKFYAELRKLTSNEDKAKAIADKFALGIGETLRKILGNYNLVKLYLNMKYENMTDSSNEFNQIIYNLGLSSNRQVKSYESLDEAEGEIGKGLYVGNEWHEVNTNKKSDNPEPDPEAIKIKNFSKKLLNSEDGKKRLVNILYNNYANHKFDAVDINSVMSGDSPEDKLSNLIKETNKFEFDVDLGLKSKEDDKNKDNTSDKKDTSSNNQKYSNDKRVNYIWNNLQGKNQYQKNKDLDSIISSLNDLRNKNFKDN